jgi:ATP-dependent exoDNAse (exonuclease V) alpha subunit
VILPSQPTPFLTKEILYTAFTRCKRSLVVLGGADVLAAGVAAQIERNTGVAERLAR